MVDAHLHVVSVDRMAYPLAPGELPNGAWYATDRAVDAQGLQQLMVDAGVACGVLVQAVGPYGADNRYVVGAASGSAGRFASVVVVDPLEPSAVSTLDSWLADGASGVRLFDIPPSDPEWLGTEAGWPLVEHAVSTGARLVVTVLAHRIDALSRVCDRVDVAVALDHCGFVELDSSEGRRALAALSRHRNLRLKVSSHVLSHVADPAATLRWLADEFGADRLMWGSDFCQTQDRSYGELVASAWEASELLTATETASFLGGTALEMWPELASAS